MYKIYVYTHTCMPNKRIVKYIPSSSFNLLADGSSSASTLGRAPIFVSWSIFSLICFFRFYSKYHTIYWCALIGYIPIYLSKFLPLTDHLALWLCKTVICPFVVGRFIHFINQLSYMYKENNVNCRQLGIVPLSSNGLQAFTRSPSSISVWVISLQICLACVLTVLSIPKKLIEFCGPQ